MATVDTKKVLVKYNTVFAMNGKPCKTKTRERTYRFPEATSRPSSKHDPGPNKPLVPSTLIHSRVAPMLELAIYPTVPEATSE